MLHPVGPEPARKYWLRRAAILVPCVVLVIAVVAAILNSAGASAVSAKSSASAPAGDPVTEPSESASSASSPSTSPQATSAPLARAASSEGAAPSPTPTSTTVAPSACRASDIRVTLIGRPRLRLEQPTGFTLSLINGGKQTCVVAVNAKDFELKIYSGTDRIWSTTDCRRAVPPITKTLRREHALEWQITWDGRRSRSDCKRDHEPMESGTYVATAQWASAEPVELRMILRD